MGPPSTLAPPESASRVSSGGSWSSQMQSSCSRCCGSADQARDPAGHEAQVVNARLVEELRSVVVMNDKWQKYHGQQKAYIAELQASVEEHKARAREADKRYSQLQVTLRLQEGRTRELEETVRCFSSAMDEADELRHARGKLEEEVRKLQESLRARGSTDEKKGNDRNQLLQEQLQVCIEDFRKEEEEKKKLQNEVSSLESKLTEANRLLKEYRDKVEMVQAINFPSIGQAHVPVNAIPKDTLSVHRRRNKVSTSAPSRSGMSCRLDGIVNFPTTIEADSFGGRPQKGFELAPKFSSSLESDKGTVSDVSSDHDSLETHVELIRH